MQNQETLIKPGTYTINDYLEKESIEEVRKLIWDGLRSQPKYIHSRFFYDDRGSELFEDITRLPEYYQPGLEMSILRKEAKKIVANNNTINIIELGSGDCSKISVLFDTLTPQQLKNTRYIPVDVSRSAIEKSADILQEKYNGIRIHGILTDFLKHLHLPPSKTTNLVCFFGSTLGNFEKTTARQLLLKVADQMNSGDELLLGLDMVKDRKIMENAYNDQAGVTAAFNKNILNAVNPIIETNFNPDDFEHLAFFNEAHNRIEMHLKALKPVEVISGEGKTLKIEKDEMIHTENSHKFTKEGIMELAALTGFSVKDIYTDSNKWFSVVDFIK